MFGFCKKKPENKLVSFLNKADQAYTRAFQVKNPTGLEEYFTRNALMQIIERIRLSQKAYSGLDRYKHVVWTAKSSDVYTKTVSYDDVQISKGVKAAVGDSYVEEWKLAITGEVYKVDGIRRIS